MGWLKWIGKGLGSGFGWLVRNREVLDGIVGGLQAARARQRTTTEKQPPPAPEEAVKGDSQ